VLQAFGVDLGAIMLGYKKFHYYGDPKNGGPDRLMMLLVFGLITMVLLRSLWVLD
jgi:hypothetical protein